MPLDFLPLPAAPTRGAYKRVNKTQESVYRRFNEVTKWITVHPNRDKAHYQTLADAIGFYNSYGKGGVIFLKDGDHEVTGTGISLSMLDGSVAVIGESREGTRIIKNGMSGYGIMNSSSLSPYHITFDNLTITNDSGSSNGFLLSGVENGKTLKLIDCNIETVGTGVNHMISGTTGNYHLQNCVFSGSTNGGTSSGRRAIEIIPAFGGENIRFKMVDCQMYTGSQMYSHHEDLYLYTTSATGFEDISISGSWFDNLVFLVGDKISVVGNSKMQGAFLHTGNGAFCDNKIDYTRTNDGQLCLGVYLRNLLSVSNPQFAISDNVINITGSQTNTGQHAGIHVFNQDGVSISGNSIKMDVLAASTYTIHGILVDESDDSTLTGNQIELKDTTNDLYWGIFWDTCDVSLATGNLIKKGATNGTYGTLGSSQSGSTNISFSTSNNTRTT